MEVITDQNGISFSPANDLLERSEEVKTRTYPFKFGEYIRSGFRLFFDHPGEFVLYFILMSLLSIVGAATTIGPLIISGPLAVGWFILAHHMENGKPFQISDFFKGFRSTMPLVLVTLLTLLAVTGGFLLFILPGIYLAVALAFSVYPVYFNQLETIDAMKVSMRFIGKRWFSFFIFFIVLGLINFLGLLALGVGVLITAPATSLAVYFAYKDIVGIGAAQED